MLRRAVDRRTLHALAALRTALLPWRSPAAALHTAAGFGARSRPAPAQARARLEQHKHHQLQRQQLQPQELQRGQQRRTLASVATAIAPDEQQQQEHQQHQHQQGGEIALYDHHLDALGIVQPLPLSETPWFLARGATSSISAASAASDQARVLGGCLRSGDLGRAEQIARQMRRKWSAYASAYDDRQRRKLELRSSSRETTTTTTAAAVDVDVRSDEHDEEDAPSALSAHENEADDADVDDEPFVPLADVLTPKMHQMFLRAYFSASSLSSSSSSSSEEGGDVSAAADLFSGAPEQTKLRRKQGAMKAWAYFDSLWRDDEWYVGVSSSSGRGKQVASVAAAARLRGERQGRGKDRRPAASPAIDAHVVATMIKGSLALNLEAGDDNSGIPPLAQAVVNAIRLNRLHVVDVFRSGIFALEGESAFGKLGREEAYDRFLALVEAQAELEERGGAREHVLRDFAKWMREQRTRLEDDREMQEDVRRVKQLHAQLKPTMSVMARDDVTPSLRALRTNTSLLQSAELALVSSIDRQVELELGAYDSARQLRLHQLDQLERVGKDKDVGLAKPWLKRHMHTWFVALEARLTADRATGAEFAAQEPDVAPLIAELDPAKLALITIHTILTPTERQARSKATHMMVNVGSSVEREIAAQAMREKDGAATIDKTIARIVKRANLLGGGSHTGTDTLDADAAFRRLWRAELAKDKERDVARWAPEWTQTLRAKVGSYLVAALMHTATVECTATDPDTGELIKETHPAFMHAYEYVRGTKLGVIRPHEEILKRLNNVSSVLPIDVRFLPMVTPPKPWVSPTSGGYLVRETKLMRTKDDPLQRHLLQSASNQGNLDQVYQALDVLGSTTWRINDRVFDVIRTVWNTGEALADIPPSDTETAFPDPPMPPGAAHDLRARRNWHDAVKMVLQDRRSAHSRRCNSNLQLEIAQALLGETMYFPHNLDFRGRAYPIPPNLSHVGDDMCRGLLTFGEAKPLGERGLRWLKIHFANMSGHDKASLDGRVEYAEEHLDDIFDSADHPLDGRRVWLKADKPWQCLAVSFELAAAMRAPEPTEYMSRLAVHQDGTCNGLQHYAALGGDLEAAASVNLDIGDKPADVYTTVMNKVLIQMDKLIEQGDEMAIDLRPKITRKVVKQTVMTTVYGVTFIGARDQIARQLKDRGDTPLEQIYPSASFLARLVLGAIGDLFAGATKIQNWFNTIARLVASSVPPRQFQKLLNQGLGADALAKAVTQEQMTTMSWTTPLGLPINQPYRQPQKRQVQTTLQTVFMYDPNIPARVDSRGQTTAFPPNFVHSLDATHMMMTALMSKGKMTFAAVHDSYWTHACDVDEMGVLLRDAFVRLHSDNRVLQNFLDETLKVFGNHVIRKQAVKDAMSEPEGENLPAPSESVSHDVWDESEYSDSALPKAYTRLSQVLPPLPQRGAFDLERTKRSLYFFS